MPDSCCYNVALNCAVSGIYPGLGVIAAFLLLPLFALAGTYLKFSFVENSEILKHLMSGSEAVKGTAVRNGLCHLPIELEVWILTCFV
jgi:hypothetical protein